VTEQQAYFDQMIKPHMEYLGMTVMSETKYYPNGFSGDFGRHVAEIEDAIQLALAQGDYFTAAGIALAETDAKNGDNTLYFGQRGLAYSNMAMVQELRKQSR
jgi:hypothetical protein